jgi:hypothetical protein
LPYRKDARLPAACMRRIYSPYRTAMTVLYRQQNQRDKCIA